MNNLQLQHLKNNPEQCPFCHSDNIEEYDSGYSGNNFGSRMECKDCNEAGEEIFEPVLPIELEVCPLCQSQEVIEGFSIKTNIGFNTNYSCDNCNNYWEVEFMLVAVDYDGQRYKLEDIDAL